MNRYKLHISDYKNPAFLGEMVFFTFTQALTIWAVFFYTLKPIDNVMQKSNEISALVLFVISFIFVTIGFTLLVKKIKRSKVLNILFYFAMFEGVWIFSKAFVGSGTEALIVTIVILAGYFIFHTILIHNTVLVVALSGISILLASYFSIATAIIILLILALYDYIAVHKSKHMVALFKGMAEKSVFFAIILPYKPKEYLSSVRLVRVNGEFMFLGTGDLIVPLLLVIPAFLNSFSSGVYTSVGSLFGLILLYTIFMSRPERTPMAGLPSLVFGTIAGYLISLL